MQANPSRTLRDKSADVAQKQSGCFVNSRSGLRNSSSAHTKYFTFTFCTFFRYHIYMKSLSDGDLIYRKLQSDITKKNWQEGKFASLVKPLETRTCKNKGCTITFQSKPYDPKVFCSRSCSVTYSNTGRIQSEATRQKIAISLKNSPHWFKPSLSKRVKKVAILCRNCKIEFSVLPYLAKRRKFCSNACAMKVIGGQTTSPKASKGKPGIRPDISPTICFYSTWEANIARIYTFQGVIWQYAPKVFDLGNHTYRPDFYLPSEDTYIEVKNFMGEYSAMRDLLFRKLYPQIRLKVILKEEYKSLEKIYKPMIPNWEN